MCKGLLSGIFAHGQQFVCNSTISGDVIAFLMYNKDWVTVIILILDIPAKRNFIVGNPFCGERMFPSDKDEEVVMMVDE